MNKRWFCLILAVCLALAALPASAAVRVTLNKKSAVVDLADGSTLQLTAKVSPARYADQIVWKSGATTVATVSDEGLVTAKKAGKVKIGARVPGETGWSICTIQVVRTQSSTPTGIVLSDTRLALSTGEKQTVTATVTPASASQQVKWQSSKPAVASVSAATGEIIARKPGKATIRATSVANPKIRKNVLVTVSIANAPTKITLSPATSRMEAGDKLTLTATVTPDDASDKITWTSSKPSVASVTSGGVVTAKNTGTTVIRAASAVKSSVYASRTITVSDPDAVTSVTIAQGDFYLDKGTTKTLSASVKPAGSSAQVTWTSDNLTVASVTTAGKVTGRSAGVANITATAGGKSDSVQVRVLTDERETTLPANYLSSASGISANSKKIQSVYASAIEELEMHVAKGNLTAAERATRKEMLQRGFVMYDMAWASDSSVRYWSGSTSYVAGRIYVGMPYTQNNRTFNLEKWLRNISYTKSDGYYHVTMPGTSYPGNDCSSFVSMCQFGVNSSYSYLNSTAMYSSTQYKTVSNGFENMMPGDVLVRQGHVAMFLYYVNSDRVMVLEQGGGSEPNTVACHIKSINSTYRSSYRVRRKATLPSA